MRASTSAPSRRLLQTRGRSSAGPCGLLHLLSALVVGRAFLGRISAWGVKGMHGCVAPNEAIYLRLEAGEEGAGLSLAREVSGDAIRHDDGSITLRFGGVELLVPGATRGRLTRPIHIGGAPGA